MESRWFLAANGLQGSYFQINPGQNYDRDQVIYSTPKGTRIDPIINFTDDTGGPINGGARTAGLGLNGTDNMTARWEGTITIPANTAPGEVFTFFTRSDDGDRLWINGIRVIDRNDPTHDHWYDNRGTPGAPGDASQDFTGFTAGQQIPVIYEFNQGGGGADAALYWGSSGSAVGSPVLIPTSNLNAEVSAAAAPTGLSATALTGLNGGQASLTWNDNSLNEARFKILASINGGPFTYLKSVPAANTSTTLTGLTPGASYTFQIQASNFAGDSAVSQSGPVTISYPSFPSGPGLVGIYLDVPPGAAYNRDVVSNAAPSGYRIDPQVNFLNPTSEDSNGRGNFGQNNNLAGTGLTDNQTFVTRWEGYLKTPGTVGTNGDFHFYTRSDDGIRLFINGKQVINHWYDDRGTPGAPGDDSGVVNLPLGASIPIVLEFNQGGGGEAAGLYWLPPGGSTQFIPSANLDSGVVAPATPTLSVGASSAFSATINVTESLNNQSRFVFERSNDGGTTWTNVGGYSLPDQTSFTFGNLTPGATYKFRVTAMNSVGAATSQVLSFTTPLLSARSPGAFAEFVNNTAPNNNIPTFTDPVVLRTGYQTIDYNYASGSPDTTLVNGSNTSARLSGKLHIITPGTYKLRINTDDAGVLYVNGKLAAAQTPNASLVYPVTFNAPGDYSFVLLYNNGGGPSGAHLYWTPPGQGESVIPASVDLATAGLVAQSDLPLAPSNLTATSTGTTVTVNWNDNSFNEYTERLEISSDNGTTWTTAKRYDVVANPTGGPSAQSFTVTGLTPNTSYKFRVISGNISGESTSAVITKSTLATTGTISGSVTTPISGNTNLTTEGGLDWVHVGYPSSPLNLHVKANVVAPRIGNFTTDGLTPVSATTPGKTFTWTDAATGAAVNVDTLDNYQAGSLTAFGGNSGAGEDVTKVLDNDPTTKYFNDGINNTGFIVHVDPAKYPSGSVAGGFTITSANDHPERDPASYQIEGSTDGVNFTYIDSGAIDAFSARQQKVAYAFNSVNTTAYTTYRVTFPSVQNGGTANGMQVAEFELTQGVPYGADVTRNYGGLQATSGNSPGAEGVFNVLDHNSATKYLNFDKLNTGFTVNLNPSSYPTGAVLGGITLTSANDAPERDPASYLIQGSNDGSTFTTVSSGTVPAFTARFQKQTILFSPATGGTSYSIYKVIFPTVANAGAANSMQVADVELLSGPLPENATNTSDAAKLTVAGATPKGFHFTVPAGLTQRRVKVYVGVDDLGTGNFTATLSDGSATPFTASLTDTTAGANTPKLAVYTIDFKANSANQTLNIDWVTSNNGTVIISAADWFDAAAPAVPTGVTTTATGKGHVNISWVDNATTETGYLIERADTAGGPFTTVATTGANVTQYVDTGLTDGTQYFYRVTAVGTSVNSTAVNAPAVTTATIAQTGLVGKFYNDAVPPQGQDITNTNHFGTDSTSVLAATHGTYDPNSQTWSNLDANVNFNYGQGSPDGAVTADNFSAQWDGKFIADYTGAYTFFTDTDDAGFLYVDVNQNGRFDYDAQSNAANGERVVNANILQGDGDPDGVTNDRGIVVNLVAGQQYAIRMQMVEQGGGAVAKLIAQGPFGDRSVIATENLLPSVGTLTSNKIEVDRALPSSAAYTAKQHLVVYFNNELNLLSPDAISIALASNPGTPVAAGSSQISVAIDAQSNSATLTFQNLSGPNANELANGNYILTIAGGNASQVSSMDGIAPTANISLPFYVLKGDTQVDLNGAENLNRKVDFADFQRLERNIGKTGAGSRVSAADGDFNHDGVVDKLDLAIVRAALNSTLAAPSEPVAAPISLPAPSQVPSKPITTPVTTPVKTPTKPVVVKPVTKPVKPVTPVKPVVVPPKTVFATAKITGTKAWLATK